MDKNKIIERLYRDHKDHVYNFIARMANDPELAMDITQQTFIKALGDKNLTEINNPKAYLFTIARNTLYNEFKRKKATSLDAIEEAGDFEAIDNSEGVHDTTELHDIQRKVEQSIKRMPAKVKELMILRYTEDLTIKEIAVVTGRTLSDVKVSLHRARIKFESSFTNEMYAKVAASREQCNTLTTMLAPYANSEIPEQGLQLVDKHITACKICSEDAEQLKRSRVLFNLGALIAAPYILDQMMSEAMASEFGFLTGTGNTSSSTITHTAANSAVSSTTKSTATKIVASKLMSAKVAGIIGAVALVGIGGIILLTNLLNKEDKVITISKQPPPVIAPVAPPPTVPSTTPAPAKAAPVVKPKSPTKKLTKLDPDATTIVSFRAKNKGQFILQGLKWDIFNTADNNGKTKSKPALVKSSATPNFNIILDSGYYLAKATYQGKTQESKFIVKNDDPVAVEINFGKNIQAKTTTVAAVKLPTIHIRRKQTGTHESNPLRFNWKMCLTLVDSYKMMRDRFPQLWVTEEQKLKQSIPGFNIDQGIIPEPNWPKLTENYEDEYFSGNKYALYSKGSTYTISETGNCKLIKTNYHRAEIDDGKNIYDIDFISNTADKNISGVITEKQVDDMYKGMATKDPYAAYAMGQMMSEAFLGKAGSAQEKQSKEALMKLADLTKVVGQETVAGETCEYTAMGEQMNTRLCYLKGMHDYPSVVKRPIILKATINIGKASKSQFFGKSDNRAIVFEKNITIADTIFSIPTNIKVIDTNSR
ncbi:MAG: RNA polymerase sigma factor [Gammaproteobacteria bacterium]